MLQLIDFQKMFWGKISRFFLGGWGVWWWCKLMSRKLKIYTCTPYAQVPQKFKCSESITPQTYNFGLVCTNYRNSLSQLASKIQKL